MASIKEIRAHIKKRGADAEDHQRHVSHLFLQPAQGTQAAHRCGALFQQDRGHHLRYPPPLPGDRPPLFDKRPGIPPDKRKTGFIVITGDKGLAGAYNHNILKLAEEKMSRAANPSLFVVGQVGRSYFLEHGIPIDVEFLYTAQDPNMGRARDMAELMLDLYLDGQLDKVYVLFTKMVSSFQMEPTAHKLLPLDPDVFPEYEKNRDSYNRDVVYVPSVKAVMDRLVPGYVKGDLFGALVESYCSEQNARMTAMKSSSDNARAMLQRLNLSFNRARQAAITQEITEVVGGAQAAL